MGSFPLPKGHYFGLKTLDIKSHDGSASLVDEYNLALWQRQYALRVDRNQPVTGRFDGPTQRACVALQLRHGLDITGTLDGPTWDVLLGAPETALESPQSDERSEILVQADTPKGEPVARRRGRPAKVS